MVKHENGVSAHSGDPEMSDSGGHCFTTCAEAKNHAMRWSGIWPSQGQNHPTGYGMLMLDIQLLIFSVM